MTKERWYGESRGWLPICPACEQKVEDPDDAKSWPEILYHRVCLTPEVQAECDEARRATEQTLSEIRALGL